MRRAVISTAFVSTVFLVIATPAIGQMPFSAASMRLMVTEPHLADHSDAVRPQSAAPISDPLGARWMARIPKLSVSVPPLVGRPSRFGVGQRYIYTPDGKRILSRDWSDGRFDLDERDVGVDVGQIDAGNLLGAAVAYTAKSGGSAQTGNVFFGTKVLRGHQAPPWAILFSPNDEWLATCSDDRTMRLWNLSDEKEIARFEAPGGGGNGSDGPRSNYMAFSPDSLKLVTTFNGEVSLRRSKDGIAQMVFYPQIRNSLGPTSLRFAPDGTTFFIFGRSARPSGKKASRIVQYVPSGFVEEDEEKMERLFEGSRPAIDGTPTPEGRWLITWNDSAEVSVWHIKRREEVRILKVAPKHLYCATLTPYGTVLATAGDDDEVKFWDVTTGNRVAAKAKYRHNQLNEVHFSHDGKYMVTASSDGFLKVWDSPKEAYEFRGFRGVD